MNTKALVTFAIGTHTKLLDIARPSYKAYARRHGYDYIEPAEFSTVRPPAWYKIPLLRNALERYNEVIFIGADLVIVDGREDFAPTVPPDAWQAMVRHNTGDGDVPNDDMWFCRKEMIPILDKVWQNDKWLNHGWWEQASLLDLMGYHVLQPTHLEEPTELFHRTHWLDNGWNVHRWDKPQPANIRIQHATMWSNRIEIMTEWAEQARQGWMNENEREIVCLS